MSVAVTTGIDTTLLVPFAARTGVMQPGELERILAESSWPQPWSEPAARRVPGVIRLVTPRRAQEQRR